MPRRYVAQVISESTNQGAGSRPFYSWLESCLRHKGEMVIMEAARAIVNMPEVTQRELQPAVTVLQLFLTSSKPTLRFAAVRTLNKVRASAQLRNEGQLRHVTPWRGRACTYSLADVERRSWAVSVPFPVPHVLAHGARENATCFTDDHPNLLLLCERESRLSGEQDSELLEGSDV